MIAFGHALGGSGNAALRARLTSVADTIRPTLYVDALFAVSPCAVREHAAHDAIGSFLLFDLQRLFLYDAPTEPAGAGIDSVILSVLDACPRELAALVRNRLKDQAYQFLFCHAVLDILPVLWQSARPGILTTCDLLTGEIMRSEVQPHPSSAPVRWVPAKVAQKATPQVQPANLQDIWTDPSLRTRGAHDLRHLISPAAGVVRWLHDALQFTTLPFVMAHIADEGGGKGRNCFGKGFREAEATSAAICEALERFHVASLRPDDMFVHGSYAELHDCAVDPHTLFFGGTTGPDGETVAYSEESAMYWTWALDVVARKPRLVPAQEIWFKTARLPGEQQFISATTSGAALGNSVEEATLFALLELIERDAYMTMWYLRRPCARIDLDSIEHEPFQLLRRRWQATFADYTLQLFDITTDVAMPAVAATAERQRGNGPRVFHAAAARLSAVDACFSALKDLAGFVQHRPGTTGPTRPQDVAGDGHRVTGAKEHFRMYAHTDTRARLSFLSHNSTWLDVRDLDARSIVALQDRYNLRAVVEQIARHLHSLGVSTLVKDISHPWLARLGLHCVNAVAPGLYPIWFGSRGRRFAVTDRLRRLAHELTGRRIESPSDVNLEIHPMT